VIHAYLCDPDDSKRSCTKRIEDLVASIDTLDERKPRTRKAKNGAAAADSPPPAIAIAK